MFSTIVDGEVDLADVFYLVALILSGVAFGLHLATRPIQTTHALIAAALGFLAAGLLVL